MQAKSIVLVASITVILTLRPAPAAAQQTMPQSWSHPSDRDSWRESWQPPQRSPHPAAWNPESFYQLQRIAPAPDRDTQAPLSVDQLRNTLRIAARDESETPAADDRLTDGGDSLLGDDLLGGDLLGGGLQ
ncbi:hypothetical protein, partial [Stieleria sp.]|uniref:hypothetical protein n=1 Tax=Stieleria sp. TaxID=2795976 RepID=UPI003566DA3D